MRGRRVLTVMLNHNPARGGTSRTASMTYGLPIAVFPNA